jgi:hypothetical protein
VLGGIMAVALSATLVQSARAQDDLIIPLPVKRKFPAGTFCTLPVVVSFVADGPTATVTYEVNIYTEDPAAQPGSPLVWTEQSIDNAVVSTTADYNANSGEEPDGSQAFFCYNGGSDPAPPVLYFNRAGLVLPLVELFDTDPTARGWDMSRGAYYVSDRSAPRDPETDGETHQGDTSFGGSLGIGQETASPSLDDKAFSAITVGGLTAGTSYTLTTWWDSGNVFFANDRTYLTIHITGAGSTPLAEKSWGGLKKSYK